ncbi:hypothetical protein [Hymenobacter sublimis]|uniref:DUF1127 domain-containing protein n=1 Tax=Hymenobacter sublimis TaxID=2933777 RepID=A0ABY4JI53_9BACT|nr:hypothetical protein [Hymenobacter sublimis]UPL50999.1 hypothetical protein MWH26_08850 [Hymenobacter sublimis]
MTTTSLLYPAAIPTCATTLTRRQRAWIALYSLDAGHRDRAEVLAQNDITEADLLEYEESWLQMRCQLPGSRG